MKFHVYAVDTCENCKTLLRGLKVLRWPHESFDANDPQYKNLLDEHGVELLPFLQLIDDEGTVVWQKSGNDVTLKEVVNQYEAKHGTGTRS